MSRALILMYHIIDSPRAAIEEKYCCTPENFAAQMNFLRQSRRKLVSLDELADRMDSGTPFDEGCVAVTFDDGIVETVHNGLPVLSELGIPATMFVLADRFGGGNDWMEARGFPRRRILSHTDMLALLEAGVTIGSHTRTHLRLPAASDAQVEDEIAGSKAALERRLGLPVRHFAYPYGQFDERAREAARRAGYRTACSTRSGFNRVDADRFALRRIEVFGSDTLPAFRRKLRFGVNDPSLLVPVRYYASRVAERLGIDR
jgi:peptidoglycan/xylan/chitin deacetylase (PgdA/CDA1 family)